MTSNQAIWLGVLQGLGEFLPISSSGHLIVVPWILGWPPQSLSFDVALHVGTLVAVLAAFAGDWWRLLGGAARGVLARDWRSPELEVLGLLALGSVPAAVAGLLLDEWAETTFRSPGLVAVTMGALGIVLWLADRRAPQIAGPLPGAHEIAKTVSWRTALLIGTAQSLALVPGVSRSGATISAALFLGLRREEAARFSFLMATPITFGAALLKVPALLEGGDPALFVPGMVAAAVVGLASIRLLLRYVRTRDYRPFVVYRLLFALVVGGLVLARRSAPG
ncbi:MAG TPA: undecaprenyl-diphosphate phosphatase [Vicinamibacteria bacterium]|jgi:undecaprenyl-diphosphatase